MLLSLGDSRAMDRRSRDILCLTAWVGVGPCPPHFAMSSSFTSSCPKSINILMNCTLIRLSLIPVQVLSLSGTIVSYPFQVSCQSIALGRRTS